MPRHTGPAENEQRPGSRDLRVLGQLFGFLRPYAPVVIAAALALLVAAAAVLGFGCHHFGCLVTSDICLLTDGLFQC